MYINKQLFYCSFMFSIATAAAALRLSVTSLRSYPRLHSLGIVRARLNQAAFVNPRQLKTRYRIPHYFRAFSEEEYPEEITI